MTAESERPDFGAFGPLFAELIARRHTDLLWHYTSAGSLASIAREKNVRATAARYLNDTSELRHGLRLISSALLTAVDKGDPRKAACSYLAQTITEQDYYLVCMFSLSENGNDLSQWRAYCPAEGGYSLGFDGEALRAFVVAESAFLAPCVYKHDEQVALATECIAPIVDALPREPFDRPSIQKFSAPLNRRAFRVAPLMKDDSFSSEREWRLVWRATPATASRLKFRADGPLLKPFVELPFVLEGQRSSLRTVMVGPMRDQPDAMMGASYLLFAEGIGGNISRSMIPFRKL